MEREREEGEREMVRGGMEKGRSRDEEGDNG